MLDWVLTLHVDLDAVSSLQLANLAATDGKAALKTLRPRNLSKRMGVVGLCARSYPWPLGWGPHYD